MEWHHQIVTKYVKVEIAENINSLIMYFEALPGSTSVYQINVLLMLTCVTFICICICLSASYENINWTTRPSFQESAWPSTLSSSQALSSVFPLACCSLFILLGLIYFCYCYISTYTLRCTLDTLILSWNSTNYTHHATRLYVSDCCI